MARKPFRVMFSCVGRRVALVEAFRRSLKKLHLKGGILGADSSAYSAALQCCDAGFLVPPCTSADYVPELLRICGLEEVDLLIPLIDPELPVLAECHERFRGVGTTLCLSAPEVVRVCSDKVLTNEHLTAAGIDTPRLFQYDKIRDGDFPLFMKPRRGSSAKDIHKLADRRQLEFYWTEHPDAIIQEFIPGQEYTLDIFTDFAGEPRCVVPRQRIEVRGGEVSKSLTVKDGELIEVGMRAVRALGGGRGPITVQCFRTPAGRVTVIEINPRLGGGVPLAIAAGADIPAWTIQCARGEPAGGGQIDPLGFQDRLVMLRYDEAVFVPEGALGR